MMSDNYNKALVTGVERISAWAGLLDEINVYPVADGDTGRNLVISLSPMRQINDDRPSTIRALMLAARGNSGNIAAKYFSGFLSMDGPDTLAGAAKLGSRLAREAVGEPREGTMLTIFDSLSKILEKQTFSDNFTEPIIDHLENAVHLTTDLLPRLKQANVIDAGALGMFIFFEGFFKTLAGQNEEYRPIMQIFKGKLAVAGSFQEESESGYCVDMVLRADDNAAEAVKKARTDKSAVIIQERDFIKIHIHTDDAHKTKDRFESYGLVKWADDDLNAQIKDFQTAHSKQAIHIMTDAAGSVTRKDAKNFGITLLDSYVIKGETCIPETHLDPADLYDSMLNGIKVSTSQASDFERHQHYESVLSRYKNALYLCVGSVYTGNYRIATDWQSKNDPDNRMTIIDTGTASGKLGISVIASARYACTVSSPVDVVKFAQDAVENAQEFIFLEKLQYLAAGGRMSKTGAFFGDMFNVKPIVSPYATGAVKLGIAKNNKDQLKFLFGKLESGLKPDSKAMIMLEYTDNIGWVSNTLKEEIERKFPYAEILIQPLSLTTGVHTGPGTWGVAYLDIEAFV
ncbi:MAG: DegV family protein [Spirochaetes bacterium]|nr:DegV family protein [Spirochaetota bacterium]